MLGLLTLGATTPQASLNLLLMEMVHFFDLGDGIEGGKVQGLPNWALILLWWFGAISRGIPDTRNNSWKRSSIRTFLFAEVSTKEQFSSCEETKDLASSRLTVLKVKEIFSITGKWKETFKWDNSFYSNGFPTILWKIKNLFYFIFLLQENCHFARLHFSFASTHILCSSGTRNFSQLHQHLSFSTTHVIFNKMRACFFHCSAQLITIFNRTHQILCNLRLR